MPCLDHTKLNGYREYCLAHLLLSTIAHSFVWQEGEVGVPKVLPRCIAVPWYHVSEYLGLKPVYCCLDMLANWHYASRKSPLDMICHVPGSPRTEWYNHVAVQVELEHACVFKYFIKAFDSVESGDNTGLVSALASIEDTIQRMEDTLSMLHEKLDPYAFYKILRPFYEGWGSHTPLLPKGLIYEGVKKAPLHYLGCSAGHSPIVQAFDTVLGIKHTKDVASHLKSMRDYMPSCHRSLLNAIATGPSLRKYVSKSTMKVKLAYNQCVIVLADLRSYYLQIAIKFFLLQANNDLESQRLRKAAKSKGDKALMKHLRGARDGTVANILPV
ncbi:indoleamine 2,3-dioxygenase 2 isoform X3 [Lingula anatina]|uniref:Indoleamine 2,3-dioxygenase 2 isoform X3 n=1 Tax=Lingula anatina TaxID=7574 RepID=A0A1S3I6E6_LINAN|nr:indoleamine 2,3-dioxygenase 2 isoform X3 [Lingula anatina]|eukprot:XP_013393827.1 indoleamine 2,3-dioxygenase 2 isoform X3 [Lingula anatina]